MSRAALVTGASRGIGHAIARVLAQEGFALTIASRVPARLTPVTEELRAAGADVEAIAANVASESDINALVEHHRARHGRLDVLVNNAGMGVLGRIEGYSTAHMDLQYAVDLRSIALLYRESLDLLRAAARAEGTALVVNLSSITGKFGAGELGLYSAFKHGVVGLTEAMNDELGTEHIKSCALCPGFVDTSLSDYAQDRGVPASTMIRSDDIAQAVRFLTKLSLHCVVPEILFERPAGA